MEHCWSDFAARWLTAHAAASKQRAVGTATTPGLAGGSLHASKEPCGQPGAIRGAILVRQSHFESRHGRIAATCWISNCRRLAS